MSQEDVLMRVVQIQKQMIDDFAIVYSRLNTAISVMSGLDEEFCRLFFTRVLAYDPENLPASVPTKQELDAALSSLGFDPIKPNDLYWWKSLQNVGNPWDSVNTKLAINRGIIPSRSKKKPAVVRG